MPAWMTKEGAPPVMAAPPAIGGLNGEKSSLSIFFDRRPAVWTKQVLC